MNDFKFITEHFLPAAISLVELSIENKEVTLQLA